MNKVAILIFALAITHTLGQCDNTVSTYFGQVDPESTIQTALGSSTASCKSLRTKATCCADSYFTTFATDKATTQSALEDLAEARDQFIVDARAAIATQYLNGNYNAFKTAAAAAKANLATWSTTAPDNTITNTQAAAVQADIDTITNLWDALIENFGDYVTVFDTYRTTRATCFTEVLKTVVSSWCLGCLTSTQLPTYGVTVDGTPAVTGVALGATVKGRLAAACQPYFAASELQGDIFLAYQYAAGLAAKTTALNKVSAATPLSAGVTEYLAVTDTALTTQKPSTFPAACTTTTCVFIEDSILVEGILNDDNLVRGGTDATLRRRVLEGRQLQTNNAFEPATDEAVITIAFPQVVGDIENTNELSALRVGVFSCIVAFFVALLI